MRTQYVGIAAVAALISACGSDGGSTQDATKNGDAATAADEFTELEAHDWKIDPGVETYSCGYTTLKEDLYIGAFSPIMPPGTHHVVLGYRDPGPADGYYQEDGQPTTPCTGVTFGDIFAYAATVGTEVFRMPEGVAEKIPAGKQLVFGLHVINTGSDPLSGRSGVRIIKPNASEVQDIAEVVAVLPMGFSVPPGPSTTNTTCTSIGDATVFAVSPHMHLTGVHMKTTAGPPPGTATTLIDADYRFTDQKIQLLPEPLHMKTGDQIQVACDYQNPGPDTLISGESTTKNEMCITFAYRYPALTPDAATDGTTPRGYCFQ